MSSWSETALDLAKSGVNLAKAALVLTVWLLVYCMPVFRTWLLPRWIGGLSVLAWVYCFFFSFSLAGLSILIGKFAGNLGEVWEELKK